MAGLNRIILIGNLGKDPEMRFTPTAKAVVNFSLAVNEGRDDPTWFKITAWEKTAELCNQFLTKGSPVCIEGSVKLETWESDQGQRSSLAVTANRVTFLGKRQDTKRENAGTDDKDFDAGIPF